MSDVIPVASRRGRSRLGRGLLLATVVVLIAACSGSAGANAGSPTADPTKDKLAQILARGTLVGYGELNYPPQSIAVPGAKATVRRSATSSRSASTCTSDRRSSANRRGRRSGSPSRR